MAETRDELIDAALALRGAAPDEWMLFLETVKRYADDQVHKVLDCDPKMLRRAQGMAMALRDLEVIFRTAPQIRAKAQEKMKWSTSPKMPDSRYP